MKVIFGEKTSGLFKKHSTTIQAYGSIRKGTTWHNTKHQIPTCKTSNIYEMPEQQHKKLIHDNVTKIYKKAPLN